MFWVDGSYYKGYWDCGNQNGEGELVIQIHITNNYIISFYQKKGL